MIIVELNGEPVEVAPGSSLLALLEEQGEPYDAALVERNGRLVRGEQLAETALAAGDRIEVVLPAFGG